MQTDHSSPPKKSRLLKAFFKDDDDDEPKGPGPGSAVAAFFMPLFRQGPGRPALA